MKRMRRPRYREIMGYQLDDTSIPHVTKLAPKGCLIGRLDEF